jgi:penicillin G amidase
MKVLIDRVRRLFRTQGPEKPGPTPVSRASSRRSVNPPPDQGTRSSDRRSTARRVLLWSSALLVILLIAGVTAVWLVVRGSLAQLDGSAALPGLSAQVTVERDELGVPTIRAANRLDAARATGFLHAQDRFFQMDLLRRMAAGELAALVGSALVDTDCRQRRHGLRAVARRVVEGLPESQKRLLDTYTAGVNTGLNALAVRPPEYLVLSSVPEEWLPEDSVLAAYTMFFFLQDENAEQDAALAVLRAVLPPKAFDFFVPIGTEWDAAIDGSVLPAAPIPTPEEFTFERPAQVSRVLSAVPGKPAVVDLLPVGSNSWAVDGRISRNGSALVANDMHLMLQLPNTWYRVRIICQSLTAREPSLDITGVTLPSTPIVVVGSNTDIAWAFTNSMVDTSDLILLEMSPDNPRLYQTAQGWKELEERREIVKVRGGKDEELVVESTIWGPVIAGREGSPKRAVRWVVHLPEAANFNLIDLEQVRDAETALRLAPTFGIPVQNFVVGDWQGRIGWTLAGRLPRRTGFTGMLPVSWAAGTARWDGWLPAAEYPRIFSPPAGRIWTANNRVAGSPAYMQTGPWVTDMGARARQIRDDLAPLQEVTPLDMLAIQLDDRAVFLERWQKLLVDTLGSSLKSELNNDENGELRSLVEKWGGRAAVDSVGYRLVRGFRDAVIELLLEPLTEACRTLDPDFYYPTPQIEEPAWTLLQARPLHLLNRKFKTYDELLVAGVDSLVADLGKQGLKPREATWGKRNTLAMEHPLSRSLPLAGRWLNMPAVALPGDSRMPRVQHWQNGASQRLAVAPGLEDQGIFHMPGGQSGHFLSPFYRAGHEAWVEGKPSSFLPGRTRHKLVLR